MKRTKLVIIATLALAAAVTTTAQAQVWLWGRTRIVSTQALWGQDGPLPRFQVSYLADLHNPETCVMSIFDTKTERISTTQVHRDSCTR